MKAYWKNIRISPKKLSVIATIIRNMEAPKALDILKFMPKKWAGVLYKVLHSAIANAVKNDWQEKDKLLVNSLIVSKWIVYKRWNPISRWRSHAILKRTSNVLIELKAK
jgi:large subunit ribosomal protein L22